MKKLWILALLVFSSCATTENLALQEDEMFLTRKYIGDFVDYRITNPNGFGNPKILWIKTTNKTYGKISAYSGKCKFIIGERLYIRRTYYMPGGVFGYWIYQVEGEQSKAFYRLSEFQFEDKILVQSWF